MNTKWKETYLEALPTFGCSSMVGYTVRLWVRRRAVLASQICFVSRLVGWILFANHFISQINFCEFEIYCSFQFWMFQVSYSIMFSIKKQPMNTEWVDSEVGQLHVHLPVTGNLEKSNCTAQRITLNRTFWQYRVTFLRGQLFIQGDHKLLPLVDYQSVFSSDRGHVPQLRRCSGLILLLGINTGPPA